MKALSTVILASALLLGGCQGNDGEKSFVTSVDHAIFGDPKRKGLERDAEFKEELAKLEGGARLALTDIPLVNPRLPKRLDGNATIVDMPATRAYVRDLTGRLLEKFPPTANPQQIEVFIISGAGYEAFANEAGDIFISARWFIDAMGEGDSGRLNEDGLAFLLAHEIAHVHLNHFKDNESFLDLETLLDTVQFAISTYSVAKRSGLLGGKPMTLEQIRGHEAVNSRIEASFSAIKAMQVGGLEPILWRANELDADTLAARVVTEAGFQPRLSNSVFDRLGEAQKKVIDDLRHQLEIVGIAVKTLAELSNQNKLITALQAEGVNLSIRAALALFKEWSESHPPIQERKASTALLYRERLYEEYPLARKERGKPVSDSIAQETELVRSVVAASAVHSCLNFHIDEHRNISDDQVLVSQDGTKKLTWKQMREASAKVEYVPEHDQSVGGNPKPIKVIQEEPVPAELRKPGEDCPYSGAPLEPNDMNAMARDIRGQIQAFKGRSDTPGYLWYVFGAIRKEQGRLSDFHENLEIGYRGKQAEPLLLRQQALVAIEQEEFDIAERRILEVEETFGSDWGLELRAEQHLKRGEIAELKQVLQTCENTDNRTVESRCDVVELKARQGGATQGGTKGSNQQQIEQETEKSQNLFGSLLQGLTQ
ncbi:MAG: hypothetical protein DHS20C03_08190 [Minwuia thermotolerans]|nr:MAG: hypothetical protein DHS20C03_08190 [Minwuia thermotolerans]